MIKTSSWYQYQLCSYAVVNEMLCHENYVQGSVVRLPRELRDYPVERGASAVCSRMAGKSPLCCAAVYAAGLRFSEGMVGIHAGADRRGRAVRRGAHPGVRGVTSLAAPEGGTDPREPPCRGSAEVEALEVSQMARRIVWNAWVTRIVRGIRRRQFPLPDMQIPIRFLGGLPFDPHGVAHVALSTWRTHRRRRAMTYRCPMFWRVRLIRR